MYIVWNSVAAIRELSEGSIRYGAKFVVCKFIENRLMVVGRAFKHVVGSVFNE